MDVRSDSVTGRVRNRYTTHDTIFYLVHYFECHVSIPNLTKMSSYAVTMAGTLDLFKARELFIWMAQNDPGNNRGKDIFVARDIIKEIQ